MGAGDGATSGATRPGIPPVGACGNFLHKEGLLLRLLVMCHSERAERVEESPHAMARMPR